MKVAFISLGVMGLPLAQFLVAAGPDTVGFNRSPKRSAALAAVGGTAADSIAEAIRGADMTITMLPDTWDGEETVTRTDGVLDAAKTGPIVVDMSTIRLDCAERLYALAAERALHMFDVPVSGGEKGAIDGEFSIVSGGDSSTFDDAKVLLDTLGSAVVHVSGPVSGQTVKAANQLLVAGIIGFVSKAMVFLSTHSIELGPALAVLNGGLAGNTVLTRKGDQMREGRFELGFRTDLNHKDLRIYRDAARAKGAFGPLGAAVDELVASLRATHGGSLDHGALLARVDKLSGGAPWVQ